MIYRIKSLVVRGLGSRDLSETYTCIPYIYIYIYIYISGGSADQGLQEEVEELGVRGWRGDCHSLPEIVECAVFDVLC